MTEEEKREERFKCVSRIYYCVLESDWYITSHYNKYYHDYICFLLIKTNPVRKEIVRFPL